jgi:hypothetical protein
MEVTMSHGPDGKKFNWLDVLLLLMIVGSAIGLLYVLLHN